MSDGDEIHSKLPRRYLNNYRDLCAPGFEPEDVAHEVARVVKKDATDFGNPPINFIVDCIEMLSSRLPQGNLLRQTVDYGALQKEINKKARQHYGNEQGMDLAKRAVRTALEEYRQGGDIPNRVDTLGMYLSGIHEARFSQRVPMTSTHLNDLSATEVDNRLAALSVFSKMEYEHLASSLARNPDLSRRITRRRYNQGLGLHDAVL